MYRLYYSIVLLFGFFIIFGGCQVPVVVDTNQSTSQTESNIDQTPKKQKSEVDKKPIDSTFALNSIDVKNITHNLAIISWSLNEVGSGVIEYGIDKNYGSFTAKEKSKKRHTQILKNLKPDTVYHYRIISINKNGVKLVSGDQTFKTKSKSKNGYKTNYGIYPVGQSFRTGVEPIAHVDSSDPVKGITAIINWKDLEPTKDNYNRSVIDNLLRQLEEKNIGEGRLIVMLRYSIWNSIANKPTWSNATMPRYILEDPKYGDYGVRVDDIYKSDAKKLYGIYYGLPYEPTVGTDMKKIGAKGYHIAWTNENVRKRVMKLFKWLNDTYKDSKVEAIGNIFDESSKFFIPYPGSFGKYGNPTLKEWTKSWTKEAMQNLTDIRAYGIYTFAPYDIVEVMDDAADIGLGISSSDLQMSAWDDAPGTVALKKVYKKMSEISDTQPVMVFVSYESIYPTRKYRNIWDADGDGEADDAMNGSMLWDILTKSNIGIIANHPSKEVRDWGGINAAYILPNVAGGGVKGANGMSADLVDAAGRAVIDEFYNISKINGNKWPANPL